MAQAAGVHRGVDQRLGGGRGVAVAGEQLGHPGQVLGHLPVAGAGGGRGQPRVCGCRLLQVLQLRAR